ncbi:MAG: ERF family protein [Clostridia bacterium]
MNEEKLNIYQKIAKIMNDVEYLQKDDKVITNTNTNAGYKAISEEKVTNEVRKAMIKYGVVIIPVEQEHKREDESINNRINRLSTVDVKYKIQNIDDKEDYIIAVSSGTGVDTQDKGIGKAMTYAYKYLLLRTFAIPTGEDTDKISSNVFSEQFKTQVENKKEVKKVIEDKKITESQIKIIKYAYKDKIVDLLKANNIEKIEDLSMQKASEIIAKLREMKKESK